MNSLTTIGTVTVCCGVFFFLFCAGLVFWYLFNQPKQLDSPEEPVSSDTPGETPGVDG